MIKLSTFATAAIASVAMMTAAHAAMVSPGDIAATADVAGKSRAQPSDHWQNNSMAQKIHWRDFCHYHYNRWDWEPCYGGGGVGYVPDCFLDWDGYIVCSGDWGYSRSRARRAARAGRARSSSARRSSRRRALRNRGGSREFRNRNRNRGGERRNRNRRRD